VDSAVAGIVLATATVATLIYAIRSARTDRQRDDAQRAQDRQWDSDRRADDRKHDGEQRQVDRDHADQMRREDDEKWERRFHTEQREAQDNEARQVIVELVLVRGEVQRPPQRAFGGRDFTHQIVISAPATYPIRQVEAQIVHNSSGNLAMYPPGHSGTAPVIENGRSVIRIWAGIPQQEFQAAPIVRFTDRHDNRYYTYRQLTERFPHTTDWIPAAQKLDQWYRTGPKPDKPED
jgi:hypothetical protein